MVELYSTLTTTTKTDTLLTMLLFIADQIIFILNVTYKI